MDIKGILQSIGTGIQRLGSYLKDRFSQLFAKSSYQGTHESVTPLVGRVSTNMQAAATHRTVIAATRILQQAEASLRDLQLNLPKQLSTNTILSPELQDSDLIQDIDELAKDIEKTKVNITTETKTAVISAAKEKISKISSPIIPQTAPIITRYNQLTREIAEKAPHLSKEQASQLVQNVTDFIASFDTSIKELTRAHSETQKGIRHCENLALKAKTEAKKYAKENNTASFKIAVTSYVRSKANSKKLQESLKQCDLLIKQFTERKAQLKKIKPMLEKISKK